MIRGTIEYQLISSHYSDKTAQRSGVPLINHINEGLVVLDRISSTDLAKRAFCLHPLLQNDVDLKANYIYVSNVCDASVVMLAMEYRSVANEYLSDKVNTEHKIRLSPLYEVNDMLVADKVQNYKDFLTYHKGSHPRSGELNTYFRDWLTALDISPENFLSMCNKIDDFKNERTNY